MKLQVNQKGSWRDVVTFDDVRLIDVVQAVLSLQRAVGESAKWCIVDGVGNRDWLNGAVSKSEDESTELRLLRMRLAYSAARSDIELICRQSATGTTGGSHWYSVKGYDEEDTNYLNRAMRYLFLIGKLVCDPHDTSLVRVLDMEGA
jgi:hypothetical protein